MSNNKAFPNLSIPPNSYVFGEFPGSMTLRNTADDIHRTSIMSESQATRHLDDRPSNLVSMSSRRHVTLLDSGDFDSVTLSDKTRTGKVTDDFANLDYRSSSAAWISEEKTEDGRFSTGKGPEFGRFLRGNNAGVEIGATEGRLANAFGECNFCL